MLIIHERYRFHIGSLNNHNHHHGRSRRCWLSCLKSSILFLVLILMIPSYATTTTMGQSYTDAELEAMTDEQLEQICVERGFALVLDEVDNTTGEIYKFTHEDFVTAAQQCLAIEQEM